MKTMLTIALLALTACGSPAHQDPALKAYADDFVKEAAARGVMVNTSGVGMYFDDAFQTESNGDTENGKCECSTWHCSIRINRAQWDITHDEFHRLLIYHELGHCVLNRHHNNELDDERIPVSIMNAGLNEGMLIGYQVHKVQMLDELFKGESK